MKYLTYTSIIFFLTISINLHVLPCDTLKSIVLKTNTSSYLVDLKNYNNNLRNNNYQDTNSCDDNDMLTGMILCGIASGLSTAVPAYFIKKSFKHSIISYGLGSSIGSFYYGNKKCEGSYLQTLIGSGIGAAISYCLLIYALPSMAKNDDRPVDPLDDSDSDVLGPIGLVCISPIIPPFFGSIGFGIGSKKKNTINTALINYNNSYYNISLPSVYISPSVSNKRKMMCKFYIFNSQL